MSFYKNVIFDLYATLIDIHTDQRKQPLWEKMAEIYAVYGAFYTWQEMKEAYFRMKQEEEKKLAEKLGTSYPEICIEDVFRRLYLEKIREISETQTGVQAQSKITQPETRVLERLKETRTAIPDLWDDDKESTWLHLITTTFRIISRETFRLYPGTLDALKGLKDRGAKIYLLSNAHAAFTRPEIEVCGLTPFFDGMYLSSDHGIRKPAKEFMEKMLKEYKLDPKESVMVGNEVYSDMKISDACGVRGILLNTAHDSPEMIQKQIKEHRIKNPDMIRVIQSGDLREILTF